MKKISRKSLYWLFYIFTPGIVLASEGEDFFNSPRRLSVNGKKVSSIIQGIHKSYSSESLEDYEEEQSLSRSYSEDDLSSLAGNDSASQQYGYSDGELVEEVPNFDERFRSQVVRSRRNRRKSTPKGEALDLLIAQSCEQISMSQDIYQAIPRDQSSHGILQLTRHDNGEEAKADYFAQILKVLLVKHFLNVIPTFRNIMVQSCKNFKNQPIEEAISAAIPNPRDDSYRPRKFRTPKKSTLMHYRFNGGMMTEDDVVDAIKRNILDEMVMWLRYLEDPELGRYTVRRLEKIVNRLVFPVVDSIRKAMFSVADNALAESVGCCGCCSKIDLGLVKTGLTDILVRAIDDVIRDNFSIEGSLLDELDSEDSELENLRTRQTPIRRSIKQRVKEFCFEHILKVLVKKHFADEFPNFFRLTVKGYKNVSGCSFEEMLSLAIKDLDKYHDITEGDNPQKSIAMYLYVNNSVVGKNGIANKVKYNIMSEIIMWLSLENPHLDSRIIREIEDVVDQLMEPIIGGLKEVMMTVLKDYVPETCGCGFCSKISPEAKQQMADGITGMLSSVVDKFVGKGFTEGGCKLVTGIVRAICEAAAKD